MQAPGLFDGCEFYFSGVFSPPRASKDDLSHLVKLAGGRVLAREPRSQEETAHICPYHATPQSLFFSNHTFIVYDSYSELSHAKVRSTNVIAVPSSWLLDCLSHFELLDVPEWLYIDIIVPILGTFVWYWNELTWYCWVWIDCYDSWTGLFDYLLQFCTNWPQHKPWIVQEVKETVLPKMGFWTHEFCVLTAEVPCKAAQLVEFKLLPKNSTPTNQALIERTCYAWLGMLEIYQESVSALWGQTEHASSTSSIKFSFTSLIIIIQRFTASVGVEVAL